MAQVVESQLIATAQALELLRGCFSEAMQADFAKAFWVFQDQLGLVEGESFR